jgi:hypothetical protein
VGASCWVFYGDFQKDVASVLTEVQTRVFAQGDYYWPFVGDDIFPEQPRPGSVDELWQDPTMQELGTHSILDVDEVCDEYEIEPAPGSVCPLQAVDIADVFGTVRPTRADFERCDELVWKYLTPDRWTAYYQVLYREDAPSEIVFWGCSGD